MKAFCWTSFSFFGYHAPAVWQCVVYHVTQRHIEIEEGSLMHARECWEEMLNGGVISEGWGVEQGVGSNVACPRFSSH